MSKALAMMWRELRAYFYSPTAYVVLAVFLVVTGYFFGNGDFVRGKTAEMRTLFNSMVFVLVFLMPILTMRLLSEELSKGTIEPLMTAPVTDAEVVVGKFLGAFVFYLLLLAPTLGYVALLKIYGRPDAGPIVAGYLGLILIGMLYIAVGVFTSVCTRVQIISAIVAFIFLGIMTFMCNYMASQLSGRLREVFQYMDFYGRYGNFSRGTVALNDVVFFVSVTCLALFLSVKVLESRKWRT